MSMSDFEISQLDRGIVPDRLRNPNDARCCAAEDHDDDRAVCDDCGLRFERQGREILCPDCLSYAAHLAPHGGTVKPDTSEVYEP